MLPRFFCERKSSGRGQRYGPPPLSPRRIFAHRCVAWLPLNIPTLLQCGEGRAAISTPEEKAATTLERALVLWSWRTLPSSSVPFFHAEDDEEEVGDDDAHRGQVESAPPNVLLDWLSQGKTERHPHKHESLGKRNQN